MALENRGESPSAFVNAALTRVLLIFADTKRRAAPLGARYSMEIMLAVLTVALSVTTYLFYRLAASLQERK